MCNATRELPQSFELLHLVQLRQRGLALPGPFFNPLLQFPVGPFQLRRPYSHPVLELRVELFKLAAFPVQLGEHADLGAQQIRDDRHRDVIDGSRGIAAQEIEIGHLDGRHEDDGGTLKPGMLTDHRGQFEAVEFGHANVDQHHPEIVFQQQLQRFGS